ncbi:hypothetical protein M3Y95_00858300 [Aphelenchoides besseyi]|nr:hypothetical protein M3Y95_00858300 [Aphelenchoides besseyi]
MMVRFNMFKSLVLLLVAGAFLSFGFADTPNRPLTESATSVVTVPATIISVVPVTGSDAPTSTAPSAENVTVIPVDPTDVPVTSNSTLVPTVEPVNVTDSTSVVTTISNGTTGFTETSAGGVETTTTAPDVTTSIVPVTSIVTGRTKLTTFLPIPPTPPKEPQSGAAGLATSFIGLTASAFLIVY